jgi:hypothetical protein
VQLSPLRPRRAARRGLVAHLAYLAFLLGLSPSCGDQSEGGQVVVVQAGRAGAAGSPAGDAGAVGTSGASGASGVGGGSGVGGVGGAAPGPSATGAGGAGGAGAGGAGAGSVGAAGASGTSGAPGASGGDGGAPVAAGASGTAGGAGAAGGTGVAGGAGQAAAPCPDDMVLAGGACMDRFEAPNAEGALPLAMQTAIEGQAWCEARGKRLCTEDEWISACEGKQHSKYPYGNTYVAHRCNDDKTWISPDWAALATWPSAQSMQEAGSLYQADPSGARAECASEDGVLDLTGNVAEWVVRTLPNANNFEHVMKGCYWSKCFGGANPSCGFVNPAHPGTFRTYEAGFRCCKAPELRPPAACGGRAQRAGQRPLPGVSTSTPASLATITTEARPTNRPVSATPAIASRARSSAAGSAIGPQWTS